MRLQTDDTESVKGDGRNVCLVFDRKAGQAFLHFDIAETGNRVCIYTKQPIKDKNLRIRDKAFTSAENML